MKIKNSLKKLIYENFLQYDDRIAIIYKNEKIRYNDLLKKCGQLSISLINKNYNKVAISIENKIYFIITVFACIFAEIPFIIIDKNSPKKFLQNILSEAKISTIISDIKIENIECINFDELFNENEVQVSKDYNYSSSEIQDAVIFFIATSGSTGKPKIAKRFLLAFLQDYIEVKKNVPFLLNEVAQQYAKLNFAYGLENTLLLLIGGTTICFSETNIGIKNIQKMYMEIKNNKASIVFWASPILKLLSKHHQLCNNMPSSIKYIYTGGEPLVISADLVIELHNRNITLINDYGSSEIGKIFTYPFNIKLRDIQNFNLVGVGKPFKGYEALILDEDLKETKEGYLYLKSEEKFLCAYVNENLKTNVIKKDNFYLYNTQDIAKIENNVVIILGRENNSVNIFGYRIELEQVEYFINQIKEIEICVVIPIYNKYREASIYCFYKGKIDSFELRKRLKDFVPNYMIPLAFFSVENIYLLANGKVDRKKNMEEFKNFIVKEDLKVDNLRERIYKYLVDIIGTKIGDLNEIYLRPFFTYGVDSLFLVDFISTVEKKENVMISTEISSSQINCLKDIVDLVNDYKKG
ncbi:AMP-binding protein [Fusobacterium polymorphum]|uniref:AMP-binding protein n=1 Tax=Fusobacterium nucleatum subsp. polymorphum TaxID=76857 RepID=UPI0030CDD254